jgi:gliding motility-associated-like protein
MGMHKKLLSILIIILAVSHFSINGQAVSLRCTEVMQNGDVLLYWNPLIIGTGFYNYTIYTSPDLLGPYTELTVITVLTQSTYIHPGAGANLAPVYYYMITNTDSGPSPPSDTLASILLTSSTMDFEIIDLNWTPLHTPAPFLPDMYPWYLLYREYPPGNWSVVDSTNQLLNLSYHFWACNSNADTVRFRIGVRNTLTGCISFSNEQGKVLQNLSNRYPLVIDSVSIDAGGKSIIGWEPGQEPDIKGYIIFKVTLTNDSIDYVDGRLSTSYIHQSSDPCSGPLSYIILSIDSCGNKSPFPFDSLTLLDKPQTTIFLTDMQYDPCLMTNNLQWNEYMNFDPPLEYTHIFVSENGGSYSLLSTIFPGQTTYSHTDLLPNTNYSYFVRAYSGDHQKTSTSCMKNVTTYNSPRPLFMYIRYVTVEDNAQVNVLFYTDTNAHVQSYRILRSTSAGGPFVEAGIIQDQGQEFIGFSDAAVDVTAGSYYYQIEVIDSCGIASIIANTARTIFLQAQALPDLNNLLTWNAYESWYGHVLGYKVYRRLDDSSPVLLAEVDSLTLSYTDNVSGLTGSVSKITYQVEAYEGSSDTLGFSEVSYSNEVLSEQEPKVYLPNAFVPRGLNNMFKPVNVFVGNAGYEFVIYNRWGQMIFHTDNPDDGWDGKYNGQYVPEGVYVYLLKFRNALDQPRQIKGNVAVIY